ncbi:hypothetical protein A1OE_800 [Candidatus Endolissoclinum faulkneri L2]|uniref:Uncharacterized protein n=1 Tax=Candidatus Endolissoclinum faulkneri L2 TaxID=1193729 RepID=K7YHF6_9PROT|nr:hypothetical protein A1OE_800 [Candidatus Endolissoclinum faulkneri L2]
MYNTQYTFSIDVLFDEGNIPKILLILPMKNQYVYFITLNDTNSRMSMIYYLISQQC